MTSNTIATIAAILALVSFALGAATYAVMEAAAGKGSDCLTIQRPAVKMTGYKMPERQF